MAIIEDLGITVTCNVTGAPLTEYDDPEPDHDISKAPDAQTSFKYVEVLDDAEFSIHLSVNKPSEWLKRSHEHALGFLVSVDGEIVQLPLLFRSHFPIQGRWTTDVVGKYRVSEGSSTGLLCKLRFASLQTGKGMCFTKVSLLQANCLSRGREQDSGSERHGDSQTSWSHQGSRLAVEAHRPIRLQANERQPDGPSHRGESVEGKGRVTQDTVSQALPTFFGLLLIDIKIRRGPSRESAYRLQVDSCGQQPDSCVLLQVPIQG
jgi:hypothetical protein